MESSSINKDKFNILIMILIGSGLFGFIYEVLFYYIDGGMNIVYYRGANFLPWIDIYALGSIIILALAYKYKKSPIRLFLLSSLSCGVLEYITGLLIYIFRDGYRAWDYNTEILSFGSINGFVCIRSILIFGVSGLILIYILVPLIKKLAENKYIVKISYILIAIILIDEIYNLTLARITPLPRACEIYERIGIHYVNSNN